MFTNLGIYDANDNNTINDNNSINDNNINADTEQGNSFLGYKKEYANAKGNNHDLLAVSSSSNLGSIVEALSGTDSVNQHQDVNQQSISASQAAFNTLLSKYTTAYNNYISSSADSNNTVAEINLLKLNNELITMAENIVINELSQMKVSDSSLRKSIDEKQKNLTDYISQLQVQKQQLTQLHKNNDADSIDGSIETTSLSMSSAYVHYLVYFFVGILLIVFIFNLSINPNADVMQSVFLLVALLAVYVISRWVNN